jgi:hypothetical protein
MLDRRHTFILRRGSATCRDQGLPCRVGNKMQMEEVPPLIVPICLFCRMILTQKSATFWIMLSLQGTEGEKSE